MMEVLDAVHIVSDDDIVAVKQVFQSTIKRWLYHPARIQTLEEVGTWSFVHVQSDEYMLIISTPAIR